MPGWMGHWPDLAGLILDSYRCLQRVSHRSIDRAEAGCSLKMKDHEEPSLVEGGSIFILFIHHSSVKIGS